MSNYIVFDNGSTQKVSPCGRAVNGASIWMLDPIYTWNSTLANGSNIQVYSVNVTITTGVTYWVYISFRCRTKGSGTISTNDCVSPYIYSSFPTESYNYFRTEAYNKIGRVVPIYKTFVASSSGTGVINVGITGGSTNQVLDIYKVAIWDNYGNIFYNNSNDSNCVNLLEAYKDGVYFYTKLLSTQNSTAGTLTYNGSKKYLDNLPTISKTNVSISSSPRSGFISSPAASNYVSYFYTSTLSTVTYKGYTGKMYIINVNEKCNLKISLHDYYYSNVNLSEAGNLEGVYNPYRGSNKLNDTGKYTTWYLNRTLSLNTVFYIYINGTVYINKFDVNNYTQDIYLICDVNNTIAIKAVPYNNSENYRNYYVTPTNPNTNEIGLCNFSVTKLNYLDGFTQVNFSTVKPYFVTDTVTYNGTSRYFGITRSNVSKITDTGVYSYT